MFERLTSNAVAFSFDQFPSSVQMEIFTIQRILDHLISFSSPSTDKSTTSFSPQRLQSAKLCSGAVCNYGDARNFRVDRGIILFGFN